MRKLALWFLILFLPCAALAGEYTRTFPIDTDNQLIYREDASGFMRLASYWIRSGSKADTGQSYTILPQVILGGYPWQFDRSRPALWCSHPLQGEAGLMTQLELRQLPLTFDELISQADSSGWAVVQSESWFLTRTLYAGPSSTAAMLGEYFPAASARILEDRGEWLHVSIWGREGWMQRGSLAFGLDMLDVFLRTGDEISLFTHEPGPFTPAWRTTLPSCSSSPATSCLTRCASSA